MPFFKLKSKRDSKEDTNPQKPEGHGIVRETLEPGERHHVRTVKPTTSPPKVRSVRSSAPSKPSTVPRVTSPDLTPREAAIARRLLYGRPSDASSRGKPIRSHHREASGHSLYSDSSDSDSDVSAASDSTGSEVAGPAPLPLTKTNLRKHLINIDQSSSKASASVKATTKGPRIIIAIDFGTTHSAVTSALVYGDEKLNATSLQSIETRDIDCWEMNDKQWKVSSDIVYIRDPKTPGYPMVWGYPAERNYPLFTSNNPLGPVRVQWVKLLLDPDTENHDTIPNDPTYQRTKRALKALRKTPVEVASDYLSLLWKFASEKFEKEVYRQPLWRTAQKTVIMTVPAVWSDQGKQNTWQAALRSGIADGGIELKMITEPEAAAFCVLLHESKIDMEVGDHFIICDSGGGTVDLIAYTVDSLSPLTIQEASIGSGGPCGSQKINDAFEDYLRMVLGKGKLDAFANKHPKLFANWMKSFNGVKHQFEGVHDGTTHVFDVSRVVMDSQDGIITDGELTINGNTLRSLFDGTCCKIESLLMDQVKGLLKKGKKIKYVYVVGGFGTSKHLQERLQQKLQASMSTKTNDIRLIPAPKPIEAVCRGALYSALIERAITVRFARRSYGFQVFEEYDAARHNTPEDLRAKGLHRTGAIVVYGRFATLLEKGDLIFDRGPETHAFIWNFGRGMEEYDENFKIKIGLLACNDKSPGRCKDYDANLGEPIDNGSFVNGVYQIGVINAAVKRSKLAEIKNKSTGLIYSTFEYKVEVCFGDALLTFRLLDMDGNQIGEASCDYSGNSGERWSWGADAPNETL